MKLDVRHVLATLVVVALFVALVAWAGRPPAARGADAKSTDFSAVRAMETIRDLTAKGPHALAPTENESHLHARFVVVDRLRALGLDPVIRLGAPSIRNVLARIEGSEGGPAVMLACHYDSVAKGPGASDDGAGVATVLEVARAVLASGSPPRRTLILLIDDGEEQGLYGARAFVQNDPWARDVAVVLDFEARGTSGPTAMFETSNGAAWLVDRYARAVDRPVASSIVYALYEMLPNDTDLTVFKTAGFQGLNFAYADEVWNYHTENDDLAHLDARSLQHMGDQGLAVTRALVDGAPLEPKGGEEVYFELFSRALVRYDAKWVWPIEIVALIDLALAIVVVTRRRRATAARIAAGGGRAALSILAAFAVSSIVLVLVQIRGARWPSPIAPPTPAWIALVAAAVAATATSLLGTRIQEHSVRPDDDDAFATWSGALLVFGVFSVLACAMLSAGSYLFSLPIVFGACFLGISASLPRSRVWAPYLLSVASFLLVACLWMPFARVLLVMVGAGVPAMTTMPVALFVMSGAPLLVGVRGWARVVLPATAGVVAIVASFFV